MDFFESRFKRLWVLLIAVAGTFTMTACSLDPMPELSDSNEEAVASYSTGLLMEHDKHHVSRYMDSEELSEELTRLQNLADNKVNSQVYTIRNNQAKEEEKAAKEEALNSTPVIDNEGGTVENSPVYIDEACELSDFTIRYKDYKVCDSYPESGDSIYFTMEPTKGKKLLVLEFDATNTSSESRELDMLDMDAQYLVSVNGGKTQFVLTTLLLNDLASYKGTIEAGQSETLVLVTEVDEINSNDITSVDLNMEIGSINATISLD